MAVLCSWAAILLACLDSGDKIVGPWKCTGGMGYTQDFGEFSADGTCRLLLGGTRQVCDWTSQVDGSLRVRYGAESPTTTVRGVIHGDQMWFMQGDHTESAWIRSGSPLDVNVTAYSRGQSLIRSGDYEHGMAAFKEAADRGYDGGQNSLAWNYAAAKDPRFRDGKKAVAYAEKAVAQLHHYHYLDTLAAALARDGQFERAVATEKEALGLLEKDTDRPADDREAAATRFRRRVALFQAHQPYTEP